MLSCKQLVENSSDYLDARLSLGERLALRLHLAMCVNCRRFLRQLKVSQALIRQLPQAPIPELEALVEKLASQQQLRK